MTNIGNLGARMLLEPARYGDIAATMSADWSGPAHTHIQRAAVWRWDLYRSCQEITSVDIVGYMNKIELYALLHANA
jgi:hypothetical protein